MFVLAIKDTVDNHILSTLHSGLVLLQEISDSTHKPWKDFLFDSSILWCNQNANGRELAHCLLPKPCEIVLSELPCINLHMSCFLLLFSCFILNLSPFDLFFASLLSCFISLSNYEFSIDNLFVFLLLALHDLQLSLLEHLHSGLL
jgi:hypothetical protein